MAEQRRNNKKHEILEKALFEEKERAQITLNSIGDAVICTDLAGKITFLNCVAEVLTGWPIAAAMGRPSSEVLHVVIPETGLAISDPMILAMTENRPLNLPVGSVLIGRDGHETPIADTVTPIHGRDNETVGAVIVFRDISDAQAKAIEDTHFAQHDALTDLPNRLLLNDRIAQSIALAKRHGKPVAVLFLDLDGFKRINDSLGHSAGDKLLQSVAKRLVQCVRESDTVSRQGGDEFVVLLSHIQQSEDAAILAKKLIGVVAQAHSIDGQDLHIGTSIGISIYPGDGTDAEALIKNADTAMYQAKESGRETFRFFKPVMNELAVNRHLIQEELRSAIKRNQFVLHYQPTVDLRTGAITGAEALIRWQHPTRGLLAPGLFVPIAEESGLIFQIGNWALREACWQARVWREAQLPLATISVNVSALEFRRENFLEEVFSSLRETGLSPGILELELTESVLMKNAASSDSILGRLRAHGVRLSVDDFGTGYSSLSYLSSFPLDTLKIDQSFIRQITTAPEHKTIVCAVIAIAKSLKLRIIAEGVETQGELAFLQAQECDEAQGFYFSPALPANQFAGLLQNGLPQDLRYMFDQEPRLVEMTKRDQVPLGLSGALLRTS